MYDHIGLKVNDIGASIRFYEAALKQGHAEDDTAAVCAVLEAKAGVKRKRR